MATFEDFWRACPKRLDKALTKAKFDALTTGGLTTKIRDRETNGLVDYHYPPVSAELLVQKMKDYATTQIDPKTYDLKEGGKYTRRPATWLNRGGWMDDEVEEEQPATLRVVG